MMGDRCYLSMRVRRTDYERLEMAPVFGAIEEEHGDTLTLSDDQANYGLYSAREEWANQGAVFEGQHSEGGEYSGAVFASDGKRSIDVPAIEGRPVVEVNSDGEVVEKDLEHAREYLDVLSRAKEILDGKKGGA